MENEEPAESLPSFEPGIDSAGHILFHSFKKEKKVVLILFLFFIFNAHNGQTKKISQQNLELAESITQFFKLILKLMRK